MIMSALATATAAAHYSQNAYFSRYVSVLHVHCVSKKRDPDIIDCNFGKD